MRIVLEGFWGVGKSTLARAFVAEGYAFLAEPDHIHALPMLSSPEEIDAWYIEQHLARATAFFSGPEAANKIMERSFLSSAAYLYANGEEYATALPEIFLEKLRDGKVLFLDVPTPYVQSHSSEVNGERNQSLLSQEGFVEAYRTFFTDVLPREYGIIPVTIACVVGDTRRSREDIYKVAASSILGNTSS